jgi:hypothetical protein
MFHRLNNEHLEDIAPNPGPGELARPAKGGPHGAGQNGAQGVGINLDCLDHETGRRV